MTCYSCWNDKHETTIDLGFYTAPLEEFVVAIYLSLPSTIIECMSCVPSFTTLRISMSSVKKIRQALTEIANIHQTRIFFWPEILHFSRRAPCANMCELDLQCIHKLLKWYTIGLCGALLCGFMTFCDTNIKHEPQRALTSGGRLNKKDGLTRYGDSHVKDKTS